MKAISKKLVLFAGEPAHYCPGCEELHRIPVNNGPVRWEWNGDAERPTFSPSVRHNGHAAALCCHYFIRAGKIKFCGDCYHALSGQTIDLPDLPDWVSS